MNGLSARDKIWIIEDELKRLPQCAVGIRHYFADGVYAREMSAPANSAITGKIHKQSQINILSSGSMSVVVDGEALEISAPYTLVAPAGSKRAFYCRTDCVWTTILGTNETDPDKIEDTLTTNNEQEYLEFARLAGLT